MDSNYYINIDVNGKKAPNKEGRDMFSFVVDNKGQVYPLGSVFYWGRGYSYLEDNWFKCDKDSEYGIGCAAKIMDDGWVMDY